MTIKNEIKNHGQNYLHLKHSCADQIGTENLAFHASFDCYIIP